jgi:hypothetical protein
MEDLIQSAMMYTYGYNCKRINVYNILLERENPMIYECSIPDEIFDTENFTLIDKVINNTTLSTQEDIKVSLPEENIVIRKRIKPIVEFIINDKDCLFWTFYIMINGIENYSQIGIKNIVSEKKEKLLLVDNVIQKNTSFLKENKIRITKHIIQNLAYENKINFQTFQVLCLLHKLSFIIKYKKCYYEYKCPTPSQPIIIELRENKKYKVLVLNMDKNLNYDKFISDNIDVSLAIGFTCYYKWSGIKKKIPKAFVSYTDEINTLGSFFQSNT